MRIVRESDDRDTEHDTLQIEVKKEQTLRKCGEVKEGLERANVDLQVWHVAGAENIIADALSRALFPVLAQYVPGISLYTFIPPPASAGSRI